MIKFETFIKFYKVLTVTNWIRVPYLNNVDEFLSLVCEITAPMY